MAYTLTVGENVYPIRSDSFSLIYAAGSMGEHQSSSCKLSIHVDSIPDWLISGTKLIDALVKDDKGNILFTGVIRPYSSFSVEQRYIGDISLEVLDLSEKMHVKVYESPSNEEQRIDGIVYTDTLDGYKVCDPENTDRSLVHKICSLCNVDVTNAPKIDHTVYRVSLERGDYLDEKLAGILNEFMHDYRFNELGELVIFQTGPIVVSTDSEGNAVTSDLETSGEISSFINDLKVTRSDDKKDGVYVSLKKYDTKEDVLLYSESADAFNTWVLSPSTVSNILVLDRDIAWDLSRLPDGASEYILSDFWVKGSNTKDTSWLKGDYTLSNTSQEGGHIKGSASGWGYVSFGYKVEVFADVSFLLPESGSYGYAGDNAESISANYVQTPESAMSLAFSLNSRYKFSQFTYQFKSFEKLEVGAIYDIAENKVSRLNTKIRITKRTISDNTGIYSYTAEGYGTATFTVPDIQKEKAEASIEINKPDFIKLDLSSNVLSEEDENIFAVASGKIFEKYGASPRWYINGVYQEALTDLSVTLGRNLFASGKNVVRLEADYNGETYAIDAVVNSLITDITLQVQYAVTTGLVPTDDAAWSDVQPEVKDGLVLWMRFKMSNQTNWTIIQSTSNTIVQYLWAQSDTEEPDSGFWMRRAKFFIWKGKFIANKTFMWSQDRTDKPGDDYYLWIRFSFDGGITWTKGQCISGTRGESAKSFDLDISPETYKLTSRGVTAVQDPIIAACTKINTTGAVNWSISEGLTWSYVADGDDSKIQIAIPSCKVLPNFTVTCSIPEIGLIKEKTVMGIQEGKAEPIYLGEIYTSVDALKQVASTTEGPLMAGDHAMVEIDGARTPYYYDGSDWVMADENTPFGLASKILSNTLYDALKKPTANAASIINLYAANFAAVNAFIENLIVRNLQIGEESSLFKTKIRDAIGDDAAAFDVEYNGKTIFKIVPSTGRVFFGEPNETLDSPLSGFMYDPSDGCIKSKDEKMVISSDGTMKVEGDIKANSLSINLGEEDDPSLLKTSNLEFYEVIARSSSFTGSLPVSPTDFIVLFRSSWYIESTNSHTSRVFTFFPSSSSNTTLYSDSNGCLTLSYNATNRTLDLSYGNWPRVLQAWDKFIVMIFKNTSD